MKRLMCKTEDWRVGTVRIEQEVAQGIVEIGVEADDGKTVTAVPWRVNACVMEEFGQGRAMKSVGASGSGVGRWGNGLQ